jgi:hypothetical protein
MKRVALISTIILGICTNVFSQNIFKYDVSISVITGTETNNPFWLHSNRYDVYPDTSAAGLLHLSVESNIRQYGQFNLKFGTEIISRSGQQSETWIHQAYLQTDAWIFRLKAGWQEEKFGLNRDSRIGSFLWSSNSRPLPKVTIGIPEFYTLPRTNNYLAIKGHLSHGWFEDNRYIKNAYLHDKAGYVKFGASYKVQFIGGLHHSAQWGGTHPDFGILSDSFNDYIKIFQAQGGGGGSPTIEQNNALGNHLGEWETALNFSSENYDYMLYKSFPFEDGSGKDFRTAVDGVYGFYAESNDDNSWLKKFSYEFIYSKWQSGPAGTNAPEPVISHYDSAGFKYGGRDNYFNNALYRDGWSYKGRSIGLPFIYYSDGRSPWGLRFPNNRILAHNLSVGLQFGNLKIDALYSYSENFGNYYDMLEIERENIAEYKFIPPLIQNSMLLSLEYPLQFLENTTLTAEIGADVGELYKDTVGILIGVQYSGKLEF